MAQWLIGSIVGPERKDRGMRIASNAKCRECGRVFDLLDENDADEWYAGHDCEPMVVRYARAGDVPCRFAECACHGSQS